VEELDQLAQREQLESVDIQVKLAIYIKQHRVIQLIYLRYQLEYIKYIQLVLDYLIRLDKI